MRLSTSEHARVKTMLIVFTRSIRRVDNLIFTQKFSKKFIFIFYVLHNAFIMRFFIPE